MNWRLLLLRLYVPERLKRRQLDELHGRTSAILGGVLGCTSQCVSPWPSGSSSSFGRCLGRASCHVSELVSGGVPAGVSWGVSAGGVSEGISRGAGGGVGGCVGGVIPSYVSRRASESCAAKAASYLKSLEAFATFTREQARPIVESAAGREVVSERLRRAAEEMGRDIRKRLRLRTRGEFHAALEVVYSVLGIDARVSASGEVLIKRCFFSEFYSAPVCRLMSALDDGMVQGLSGGCRLRFVHRLTEGYPCCLAMIEEPARGCPRER